MEREKQLSPRKAINQKLQAYTNACKNLPADGTDSVPLKLQPTASIIIETVFIF